MERPRSRSGGAISREHIRAILMRNFQSRLLPVLQKNLSPENAVFATELIRDGINRGFITDAAIQRFSTWPADRQSSALEQARQAKDKSLELKRIIQIAKKDWCE